MNPKSKATLKNTRKLKVARPVRSKSRPAARIALKSGQSQSIFVAGPFNGWNPTAIQPGRLDHGQWHQEIELPEQKGDYMFIVHVVARP